MGWLTEGFPEEVTSELSPDGKIGVSSCEAEGWSILGVEGDPR